MSEPTAALSSGRTPPLITVAMSVYNGGSYLKLAVMSVVYQSIHDWELLIIDDGSTDNALESILKIVDSRIRVIQDGKNLGLAARLNQAIDLARGQYFARMDQDDICYKDRFKYQLEALLADPTVDLSATRTISINERNLAIGFQPIPTGHDVICSRPWQGFYMPHPTWFGRTEWFRKHRYASPGPYFTEDQELLLRSYTQSRFMVVDKVLLGYRIRGCLNTRKLLRTRATLFSLQMRRFAEDHRWHFILASFAVFLARVLNDLPKCFGVFSRIRKSSAEVAKTDEAQEWGHELIQLQEWSTDS